MSHVDSLRILHTSDLHGKYQKLLTALEQPNFDLWLDTGDFFPDARMHRNETFADRQALWWRDNQLARRISSALSGRPALICSGNHDFISLTTRLRAANVDAHEINPDSLFTLKGISFAGFHQIPLYDGVWPSEVSTAELIDLTSRALSLRPNVLVTHAPPERVLDLENGHNWGIYGLRSALIRSTVHTHFCGHVHSQGGCQAVLEQVEINNGARQCRIHELFYVSKEAK